MDERRGVKQRPGSAEEQEILRRKEEGLVELLNVLDMRDDEDVLAAGTPTLLAFISLMS